MVKCFHDPLPLVKLNLLCSLPRWLLGGWGGLRFEITEIKMYRFTSGTRAVITDETHVSRNTWLYLWRISSPSASREPAGPQSERSQCSLTANERCGGSFIKEPWHKFMLPSESKLQCIKHGGHILRKLKNPVDAARRSSLAPRWFIMITVFAFLAPSGSNLGRKVPDTKRRLNTYCKLGTRSQ